MSSTRHSGCTDTPQQIEPIILLWILRLLVPLGAHREFINRFDLGNEKIANVVGLGAWVGPQNREFNPKKVLAELWKRYQEAERTLKGSEVPTLLKNNIQRLSTLVGLTEADCRILEFAILIKTERLLDEAAEWLGDLSTIQYIDALAVLLDLDPSKVRESVRPQGGLARSGLLSIDHRTTYSLSRKFELLSDSFAGVITSSDADPFELLRGTVEVASKPELSIEDYEHVSRLLSVLRPYLKESISRQRKGVNVFLYGDPGTGKSQLARVLACELDCDLFEVASQKEDGEPVVGEKRLMAYKAVQSFFTERKAMIVFDEAADVFDDGDTLFGRKSTAQTRKAWINKMLEENAVPTLWLSNSIRELDPAFIRRFDMVFELPVPPKRQRERIISEACSDLIDAKTISRIAESASLTPAVVTKAASVVRSIRDELDSITPASAFELLVGNTLEAQGHQSVRHNDSNRLPDIYDPVFIHADADLAVVAQGLVQAKCGRLCLYGPPGTGKTAYGRWLADEMGVPLMVKKASDLMSMWVGGNEKNIARAFRTAEQDGALLLIDEIDSFLQDRRGARQGWEVSLVNEMLTQMESFPGVFIASTNLMDGLDQAALRRFDLKVKFDFLEAEQAYQLLCRYCEHLFIPLPEMGDVARIKRLQNLTPGDFAAVVRQSRFRPVLSPGHLITALEAECALKEGASSTIGFM